MRERTLKAIALSGTVIGLLCLLFLSQVLSYDSVSLSRLDGLGTVQVNGVVTDKTARGSLTVLEIMEQSTVDVVLFTNESLAIELGDEVEIVGSVSEYLGQRQIIGDRVLFVR